MPRGGARTGAGRKSLGKKRRSFALTEQTDILLERYVEYVTANREAVGLEALPKTEIVERLILFGLLEADKSLSAREKAAL